VQCDRQQADQNSEKFFRRRFEEKYIEDIEIVIEKMNHYCKNRNRVKFTQCPRTFQQLWLKLKFFLPLQPEEKWLQSEEDYRSLRVILSSLRGLRSSLFWDVMQPRFLVRCLPLGHPIGPVFNLEDEICKLYRNVGNLLLVYAA